MVLGRQSTSLRGRELKYDMEVNTENDIAVDLLARS